MPRSTDHHADPAYHPPPATPAPDAAAVTAVADTADGVPAFSDCLGTSTRMLSRYIASVFDAELRPFGLKGTQVSVLTTIHTLGPISAAGLAKAMHADQSTISRNVSRLADLGLVDDSRCCQDARACKLTLTDAGREKLRQTHPAWQRAQGTLRETLGPTVTATLLDAAASITTAHAD